jgi:predicted metalloprotease with PDZ domain
MRAFGALAAAIAALASIGTAKPEQGQVNYRLTPEFDQGGLIDLQVSVSLRASTSGRTRLDLPDESMGVRERWRLLSSFEAKGARLEEDGPAHRVLISKPNAPLTVTYRVHSAYAGDPQGVDGNPYKGPIVRPAWFATHGDFVFVTPQGRDHAPATFGWGALPKGWTVASNLDGAGRRFTVDDVSESTLLGGTDVRLYVRPIPGGVLRLAMRGDWRFADGPFADEIASVVSAQRGFWGGSKTPYFVSLIPLAPGGGHLSVGGTGRFQGFALFATANAPDAMLRRILAHEHIHNWIPRLQGRMPEGAQEPSAYWYSEGFTDFYTDRTLLRSGQWTPQDFVAHLNTVLREYDSSPLREAPNSVIVSDFWKSQTAQALPYQRGYLLAFLWDARMRRATHGARGFDDVMFEMRDRYVAAHAGAKPMVVESFEATAKRLTGVDVGPDIETFVTRGAPIALPPDLFEGCASVGPQTVPAYNLGFDAEASAANGVFTGVDPAGPAYRAGLRDGMKRIAREGGAPGDSRVAITYRVKDESGAEQVVRYKPEGQSSVSFQEVAWVGRAGTPPAACSAILSGAQRSR